MGVASKDQVDVLVETLREGVTLVEQGDNDVGFAVGVVAVLEVGSSVVGDGNRIVEGQASNAVLSNDIRSVTVTVPM